jgi:hypothetical protein
MTRARDLADLGGNAATLEKQGLTLINTTSFSAASTVSLANNTFTSAYKNYKIHFAITSSSTAIDLTLRLRGNGSDLSGSNYDDTVVRTITSTASGFTNTGATSADFGSVQAGIRVSDITIYDPLSTGYKAGTYLSYFYSTASNYRFYAGGFNNQSASTADALSIICSTGNITGYYRVYGLNE